MKFFGKLGIAVATLVAVSACEPPPVEVEQLGFRGTGMELVSNPRTARAADEVPAAAPPAPAAGPRAADVYENVQVLGDLAVPQFVRLMQSMTAWVAPEQGCIYCHVEGESLASDDIYTKKVARRMLQMTRAINEDWSPHVGSTGVTCYTCHRGNNVPQYGWNQAAADDARPPMVGYDAGQNKASANVGFSSLPYDPFSGYITDAKSVRVLGKKALPNAASTASIQDTEKTYALMIHLSQSLGVNCTFCHNSRAFAVWEQSGPKRVTAWQGLNMVRDVNTSYVESVESLLPPRRLGVHGDVQKVNCMTCHQGQSKPLNGVSMLADYPELLSVSREQ